MVRPSITKVCTFVMGRNIVKSEDSMVLFSSLRSEKSAINGTFSIELRNTKAETLPMLYVKIRVSASTNRHGAHSNAVEERNP